jgi:NADH-quinone oxidoreductase subunit E
MSARGAAPSPAGEILARHSRERESLVPILQDLQDTQGYLGPEALAELAQAMGLSENEIYGVATFYTQFRFAPPAEHTIRVCQGTACHVRGSHQMLHDFEERLRIKAGEQTADHRFELARVACVGCCALAPVVQVNGDVRARMSAKLVRRLLTRLGAD